MKHDHGSSLHGRQEGPDLHGGAVVVPLDEVLSGLQVELLQVVGVQVVAASSPAKQWKRISHKQSARWQDLSRLKASAFFPL